MRHLQFLLGNPCCSSLRRRAFWLNGRFKEYYASRFLEVVLTCYMDTYRRKLEKKDPRVEIKVIDELPEYRMVMSDSRVLIQVYARRSDGRKDDPILAHRVLHAHRLNEKLLPEIVDACKCFREGLASGGKKTLKSIGPVFHDKIIDTVELADRLGHTDTQNLIYMHYYRKFKKKWDQAPVVAFIDDWPEEWLRLWAKCCGTNYDSDHRICAEDICKSLGLVRLLLDVRNVRNPSHV